MDMNDSLMVVTNSSSAPASLESFIISSYKQKYLGTISRQHEEQ